MQDFFDQQQAKLIDFINDPSENNVGHFVKQIYHFAQGGMVPDETLSNRADTADMGLLQRISNAAQKTVNDPSTGRYGESALGMGFYNSPVYIASHYSQLGKFFQGAEPGNFYTNRYEQPQKAASLKSEDPNAFYSRWYESMRRFAQAEEVSSRGQTQVRGT